MEKLKEFLKSNKAQTFYWQTGTNFIILVGVVLSELDTEKYPLVLFAIPVVNYITKAINLKYQELKAESKSPITGIG